jgi:hypothetical protein
MTQRISYVALEDMTAEMRAEMERCAREGTPRPESSAVRARPRSLLVLRELLTLGQQSWLRMLNIDHHTVLAGGDASMAPGHETPEEVAARKAADDYWAKV